ncbi:MAG: SUF system NifU family Fe-S cluster assembly protein, partial [Candidatus Latescibacteria bacterium]|nr:SUF system NifU family Fe-S cluster assembly protein [Candidatus Latescibacterota bacterium]
SATRSAQGHNPLCGDKVQIYLQIDNDRITDISFQGSGCAISKASASLMTDAIKGKTLNEVEEQFRKFHTMLTDPTNTPDLDQMGKLAVFSGVRDYPARVKCATLSWHTLKAAIENAQTPVTTERDDA